MMAQVGNLAVVKALLGAGADANQGLSFRSFIFKCYAVVRESMGIKVRERDREVVRLKRF